MKRGLPLHPPDTLVYVLERELVMNAVVQMDPFARLLESQAKGFFFLKLALGDYTSEQKLLAIVNRAHSLYDRAVAENNDSSFLPVFSFRRDGEKIQLVITRENGATQEPTETGVLVLAPVLDSQGRHTVLALETTLPIPHRKLKDLSLDQLKKELELYYELLGVCTASVLGRLVKSCEELQVTCEADWRYDLSSSDDKIGISVRKNGKRLVVLFAETHM